MGPVADPACRRALSHFHRFCFGALPRSPRAIALVFALFRASLERSPRLAARLATLRAGARDKALLARPDIARWLLGSFREGLRRGVDGPVLDLQLFSRELGRRPRGHSRAGASVDRHCRHCGAAERGAGAGALDPRMRRSRSCAATGISGWPRATARCWRGWPQRCGPVPKTANGCGPRADGHRRAISAVGARQFSAPPVRPARCAPAVRARPSADRQCSSWLSRRARPGSASMASPGRHASLCGMLVGLAIVRRLVRRRHGETSGSHGGVQVLDTHGTRTLKPGQAFQGWLPGSETYPARPRLIAVLCMQASRLKQE